MSHNSCILQIFLTKPVATMPKFTEAYNEDNLRQKMTFKRRWLSTEDDIKISKVEYLSKHKHFDDQPYFTNPSNEDDLQWKKEKKWNISATTEWIILRKLR